MGLLVYLCRRRYQQKQQTILETKEKQLKPKYHIPLKWRKTHHEHPLEIIENSCENKNDTLSEEMFSL